MAPLSTLWFGQLERLFGGQQLQTVLCKTCREQAIFAPMINSSAWFSTLRVLKRLGFMIYQGLLEGRALQDVQPFEDI